MTLYGKQLKHLENITKSLLKSKMRCPLTEKDINNKQGKGEDGNKR
jgi:hypothetical protein